MRAARMPQTCWRNWPRPSTTCRIAYPTSGRREEAYDKSREATNLFRDLVTARPDVHRPGLAMSLNNMSVHLSHLEQLEDALAASQEATDIYSALAATRPAAFHPDLAMSLTNLSNRLFEFGRRDRALAAIEEATGHLPKAGHFHIGHLPS